MNPRIRQELPKDYNIVFQLIEKAFRHVVISDKSEHFLVERLRKSEAFVPELSLVAVLNQQIVGHILLTKIDIKNEQNSIKSLALAPISVLPKFQRKGVGGHLIKEAHKRAKELGFTSIVLLGHAEYYPRFGYELCQKHGISLPFEAPPQNCMVIELTTGALDKISGTVVYSKAFFG